MEQGGEQSSPAVLRSSHRPARAWLAGLARIGAALGVLAGLALGLGARRVDQAHGPASIDVVLVVIDTLRARNVSLYGYERRTTPNLEALARDGVTWDAAITPGTWTVPAHGAIFTGLMPSFHGAERVKGETLLTTPLNPEVRTLAEILGENGWQTGAFIGNTTYVTSLLGFDRGFERFSVNEYRVSAKEIVEDGLAWFAAAKTPAFLFVNIVDPHEPYAPPPPFNERFPGRSADIHGEPREILGRSAARTPAALEHFRALYDGDVAFADWGLGELLAGLRRLGRYRDTLIVVTSDHGEHFGENDIVGHGKGGFEPLLHVPLVVKYPADREAGARVARRVSTIGIFGTILAEVGILPPAGVAGTPLDVPHPVVLEDINAEGQRFIVAYQGDRKILWRIDPTRGDPARQDMRVYDLVDDPAEAKPLPPASAPGLERHLRAFAARPRPINSAPAPVIDAERERALRRLGYVE